MVVVKSLLLPPGVFLVLLVAALFLYKSKRVHLTLLSATIFSLYISSTPIAANLARWHLETMMRKGVETKISPQAVVVIAGDVRKGLTPSLGPLTLDRLTHGVRMMRRSGLPLLVSGGTVRPVDVPSATIMARVLREDFRLEPRWVETESGSTWGNAVKSARILKAAGISEIYLVTQGWHMPRAALSFRRQGLSVVPAPTTSPNRVDPDWRGLLPSASALSTSYFVSHELLGLAWYGVRYR